MSRICADDEILLVHFRRTLDAPFPSFLDYILCSKKLIILSRLHYILGEETTRVIMTRNDLWAPQLVKFSVAGNMSEFVSVSENNFIALGKDERKIEISASVPAYLNGAEKKKYTGTLLVTMKRIY